MTLRKDRRQVTYYLPREYWPTYEMLIAKLGSSQAVIDKALIPMLEKERKKQQKKGGRLNH